MYYTGGRFEASLIAVWALHRNYSSFRRGLVQMTCTVTSCSGQLMAAVEGPKPRLAFNFNCI